MKLRQIQWVALILFICNSICLADPQCLNQSNQPVDWFIALKFPSGTSYAYCDSLNCNDLAVQTDKLDNLASSPLFNTLKQIQNINSDSYATFFWNDEPPTFDVSGTYAHAKGFIGTGKDKGFVVVHSTPKFPLVQGGQIVMEIKSNQTIYGQHYFCVSTKGHSIDQIAAAYNVDWPYVYDGNIPTSFTDFPFLQKLLKNTRDLSNNYLEVDFQTLEGVSMKKFGKSGQWLVPFYDNVPAALLKIGLVVESWRFNEDSDCDQEYIVTNNLLVSFPTVTYKETVDHSKYAISLNDDLPYVCLGDINRAKSQWKRGGGTVCFAHSQVHKNFKKIMISQSTCPISSHY